MENMILGLLLLSSRTIYQLRDRIDKGLSLMFSSSMGSIQAAIKKLLDKGFIGYEERTDNGKYKKFYYIKDSGRASFFNWVNSPMDGQGIRFPEFAKVYFMGFAEKESRAASVEQYLEYLRRQHLLLDEICNSAAGIELSGEAKEIFDYQYLSAAYGRDMTGFNIAWFENLLQKIKEDEND